MARLDDQWAFEEFGRLVVHMNTLSAGSIVVIATFAEKFSGQGPGWLLAVAVAGFAVTILACLTAYFVTVGPEDQRRDLTSHFVEVAAAAALFSFAASLVSLAIFAAIAVT